MKNTLYVIGTKNNTYLEFEQDGDSSVFVYEIKEPYFATLFDNIDNAKRTLNGLMSGDKYWDFCGNYKHLAPFKLVEVGFEIKNEL